MKALVIAPQPFFSPRGTPLSVYYRTLITAELGVEVDLLTYGQGQDVTIPGVRIVRLPKFNVFGSVKVGPSYLKLFLDCMLTFKAIRLLLTNKYAFVHAHEEAVFFCLLLKPLFGFKLIYDMHSSLPHQLTNFQFTRSRPILTLFEKLEHAALRSADAVITICEDLRRYADEKMQGQRKSFLIENSMIDPIRLASNHGDRPLSGPGANGTGDLPVVPSGKRLVVYAGTLEPYQGIELALRAFEHVVKHHDDVFLLIAGGTKQQVQYYSEMAAGLGLSRHCLFVGSVSKPQATTYTRMARVLLSPRTTGNNTPLKIYEQLASGIPLVATNIHAHTQVLTEDVAFLVSPDPDALATGMLQALESNPLRDMKARKAQQLYQQKYSRDLYKRKMDHVLKSVS